MCAENSSGCTISPETAGADVGVGEDVAVDVGSGVGGSIAPPTTRSANPITPTPKALARDPSAKRRGLIRPSTDHPMIANPTRIKIPAAIATSTFQAMRTAAQPAFVPPTSRSRCAGGASTSCAARFSFASFWPLAFDSQTRIASDYLCCRFLKTDLAISCCLWHLIFGLCLWLSDYRSRLGGLLGLLSPNLRRTFFYGFHGLDGAVKMGNVLCDR